MTQPSGGDPLRDALQARLGAHYRIESLLGRGGMGSVYRAVDLTLDRPVAIKVIGGDVTTNPQLRERFLLEARTVAKLRHPNIVAVYSAGDADGLLYFAMELVPGESLRDLLAREKTVEKGRGERILHELALALDYAHANGIVHRDVKPENILLDRETGRAMLTDFGVARALEGDGHMTGTGMILGSPRYMSPEQATGEKTLDGRSDLYSLALVGYEMFTGQPVVDSGNVAGMLVKHLTETPKPLADVAPGVPEGAAVAIDRALEKDRDARWRSGREMAEVIGMAWTPAGTVSGAGTRTGLGATRAALAGRKRRAPWTIGVGIVAALSVAAIAWAMTRGPSGDPRRSYAVLPFEVQTGNAEAQWLRDGAVNMLTMALGQWNDLSVVDYERTLMLVREAGLDARRVDLDQARDIARRSGAGTVVMGQISTTTDSLLVTARLYDVAKGTPLNTSRMAAALGADPRPLFDQLARHLLDIAGGASSASVELARATTSSIEAFRAYLDGVRLMNSWRLPEADSAFRIALRADSTFALAWHKRSLALGWGDTQGSEYVRSAERAFELSDRLPAREQALVRGHHALVGALTAQLRGDTARRGYAEARRIYGELLARDSLVAEGWYGLADALFHDQSNNDSIPYLVDRITRSIRAFNRTLELDSTFHLAYSHLVQQYQGFTQAGNLLVIDGDSVLYVADSVALRRAGGPAAVDAMRRNARSRGIEIARSWAKADPDAAAPYATLANSYALAALPESSVAVLDRALARPALKETQLPLLVPFFRLMAEDPRAWEETQIAFDAARPEMLRRLSVNDRLGAIAAAITTASSTGNEGATRRMADVFVRTDSVFPFTSQPTRPVIDWYVQGLRLGMGAPMTPEMRRTIAAGIRGVDGASDPISFQLRNGAASVPFVAFLATRDTVFSNAVRRWSPSGVRHTDLDALEALSRKDTAAARAIATTYTRPDSLASARFSMAGLRAMARVEVFLALGDTAKALAYYEAISPSRFNNGFIEPGYVAYNRTFAARARLYEDRGETAKAIAAWEEFMRRFEQADGIMDSQKAEARTALRRLRETRR